MIRAARQTLASLPVVAAIACGGGSSGTTGPTQPPPTATPSIVSISNATHDEDGSSISGVQVKDCTGPPTITVTADNPNYTFTLLQGNDIRNAFRPDSSGTANVTVRAQCANGPAQTTYRVDVLPMPDLTITLRELIGTAPLNPTMRVSINGQTYDIPLAGARIQAKTGANQLSLTTNTGFRNLADWNIAGVPRTPLNENMTSATITLDAADRVAAVNFLHRDAHPAYRTDADEALNSENHVREAYNNYVNGGFAGIPFNKVTIYTPRNATFAGPLPYCATTSERRANLYKQAVADANVDNRMAGRGDLYEHVIVDTLPTGVLTYDPNATIQAVIKPGTGIVCDGGIGPRNNVYYDANGHFRAFSASVPENYPDGFVQSEVRRNLSDMNGEYSRRSNWVRANNGNASLLPLPSDSLIKQRFRPMADELAAQGKKAPKF